MEKCPRCHEPLPADVYLDELPTDPDRHPAYRLRHKKASGRRCVAYVGPEYLFLFPPRHKGDTMGTAGAGIARPAR